MKELGLFAAGVLFGTAGKIHAETYEKKGLFHFGKKKD